MRLPSITSWRPSLISWTKINLDSDPFGEGATRWAFLGIVARGNYHGFQKGHRLVVKAIKASMYNQGIRLSSADIESQELAKRLCDAFNDEELVDRKIFTVPAKLVVAEKDHFNSKSIQLIGKGENILLEPVIEGEYEKFNSNNGWANESEIIPQFFSHWTWVYSEENYLVCDLQGHRGRPDGPLWDSTVLYRYYSLTDPGILSREQNFGCNDLGLRGIVDWFGAHKCNSLCRQFGITNYKVSLWDRLKVMFESRFGQEIETSYLPAR